METPTTTTTEPTPPTPAQRVQALDEMRRLTVLRDAEPEIDLSGRRKALNEQILEQGSIFYAPEPTPVLSAAVLRERIQKRTDDQVVAAELARVPQGSDQAKELIDYQVARDREWSATQPAAPQPGEITWQDVDRTPSLQRWTPDHRRELVERMKGARVSPMETVLVGAAIQDFRELRPAAWERPPAEYDQATRTKAERALAVLYPDAATREDLRDDGLWNQGGERLIAALVELGERLAKR